MASKPNKSDQSLKEKEKVKYIDTLDTITKARYVEKIRLVGEKDPYQIPATEWISDVREFPDISYPDIVNYLVNTQSAYTLDDLKAYKSLESYNYFICGWVKDVQLILQQENCLLTSRVQHSQRMSATPLQPWVITKKSGTVLAAHCNCMAGLGEACSHVGAMLFALEAMVKVRNSKTVTEEKAYWLLPTGIKKVDYKPVREIDFQGAKSKKRDIDQMIENNKAATPKQKAKHSVAKIPAPSEIEMKNFFQELHLSGTKAAILSLVPEYSNNYVPSSVSSKYPLVLNELRDENCFDKCKEELVKHCESMAEKISVTKEQATNVESATKLQAGSKVWHRFRSGRITASRLKAVCRTSLDNPAQSIIKGICYPHVNKFTTTATKWGCDHEKEARGKYEEDMKEIHENLSVSESGLVINPQYPHMGATPDGIVKCDCCGDGCLEIKCPYCIRDKKVNDTVGKKSCLEEVDGKLQLKRTHEYYYQVQCQLFVCEKEYCDFVVWTERDMFCERIEPDTEFWLEVSQKANTFFNRVILLELVGKFFSRPNKQSSLTCPTLICTSDSAASSTKVLSPNKVVQNSSDQNDDELICICQTVYDAEYDAVIGCDNENCPYVWLHYKCINLKRAPKGKWYCPTCRLLPEFKRKGKNLKN